MDHFNKLIQNSGLVRDWLTFNSRGLNEDKYNKIKQLIDKGIARVKGGQENQGRLWVLTLLLSSFPLFIPLPGSLRLAFFCLVVGCIIFLCLCRADVRAKNVLQIAEDNLTELKEVFSNNTLQQLNQKIERNEIDWFIQTFGGDRFKDSELPNEMWDAIGQRWYDDKIKALTEH